MIRSGLFFGIKVFMLAYLNQPVCFFTSRRILTWLSVLTSCFGHSTWLCPESLPQSTGSFSRSVRGQRCKFPSPLLPRFNFSNKTLNHFMFNNWCIINKFSNFERNISPFKCRGIVHLSVSALSHCCARAEPLQFLHPGLQISVRRCLLFQIFWLAFLFWVEYKLHFVSLSFSKITVLWHWFDIFLLLVVFILNIRKYCKVYVSRAGYKKLLPESLKRVFFGWKLRSNKYQFSRILATLTNMKIVWRCISPEGGILHLA